MFVLLVANWLPFCINNEFDAIAVTSLLEVIPPKVELCPSQSASGQRLVYTTSETVAIVPKPEVRFRTGDGLRILPHTCSHYGNASTNHSFALGTHRILCRARDRHATAHCQFDIHVIGTRKRLSVTIYLIIKFICQKHARQVE